MNQKSCSPTPDEVKALKSAYKELTRAVSILERCKRCKVDTGEVGDICTMLVDRYQALASEFGINLEG